MKWERPWTWGAVDNPRVWQEQRRGWAHDSIHRMKHAIRRLVAAQGRCGTAFGGRGKHGLRVGPSDSLGEGGSQDEISPGPCGPQGWAEVAEQSTQESEDNW